MSIRLQLLLVFLFSLLLLHVNGRVLRNGEITSNMYVPLAIARDHTFLLDAFPHLAAKENYTVVRDKQGHLISKKTVLPPLLMTPFYAAWRVCSGHWPVSESAMLFLGKLTMTLCAALAAVFLAAALAAAIRRRWLAMIAGFGLVAMTTFWFPAQGGWPHAPLGLFNAATLYLFVTRRNQPSGWYWMGMMQGLAIAGRVGCVGSAFIFAAAILLQRSLPAAERARRLALYIIGALPAVTLLCLYNRVYFGGYLSTAFGSSRAGMMRLPFEGMAGMLLSPGEGLFLFSPVLLLAFQAMRKAVRARHDVQAAFCAFTVHLLYWGCYVDWWGGSAWGSRYLTEALPFIVFIAAAGLDTALTQTAWKRALAATAVFLAIVSTSAQLVGMFKWDNTYHVHFDPGFWVNDGQHWAWSAPYEPWWTLRNLPCQKPGWVEFLHPAAKTNP